MFSQEVDKSSTEVEAKPLGATVPQLQLRVIQLKMSVGGLVNPRDLRNGSKDFSETWHDYSVQKCKKSDTAGFSEKIFFSKKFEKT